MILRQILHNSPAVASSYLFGYGRGLSGKTTSTIGFDRRFNKAFAIEDRQAFVDLMVRGIPLPPPNAAANRARNLGRNTEVESLVTVP
jgi:hypothetical protein